MSRTIASLAAAIAIGAGCLAPASADTPDRISTPVSYGDLDLTRVEGIKTLTIRLTKAIDAVCGRPHDTASQTIARKIRACRTEAMENAVASINAPLLTALHQAGGTKRTADL